VLVVTPAGNSHRSPLLLRRHSHPLWGDKNCRVGNPVTDSPPSESRRAGRRAGNRSARLPSAGGRVAAARHLQIALKMLRTEDATAAPRGGGRSGVGLAEGAREQPARRECAQSPPVAPASPGEAAATTWPSGYVIVAPFACLLRPLSARSIQPSSMLEVRGSRFEAPPVLCPPSAVLCSPSSDFRFMPHRSHAKAGLLSRFQLFHVARF